MQHSGVSVQGRYRDLLKGPRGQILHDSGWRRNTIVERGRILLAGFLKNEASVGIQFLAVGQGLASWDSAGIPAPEQSATDLVARYTPVIPVASLQMTYLDASETGVAEPTPCLQITATLEPGYPAIAAPAVAYPLREFGLFGTFGGTDFMINSVRHAVIHKDAAATLIRVIRLSF